jgi:type IV pilus assembly protein PilE
LLIAGPEKGTEPCPTKDLRRAPFPTSGKQTQTNGLGQVKTGHQNRAAMKATRTYAKSRTRSCGFTLVELMITVVVIAVLAALAYPSFLGAIRKSRRSDAVAALTQVQQAQERWRNNKAAYAGNALLTTEAPNGLNQSAVSPSGYYDIAISGDGASTYTLTATAKSSKTQAEDAGCQVMSVSLARGSLTYGGAASGTPTSDPTGCWAR